MNDKPPHFTSMYLETDASDRMDVLRAARLYMEDTAGWPREEVAVFMSQHGVEEMPHGPERFRVDAPRDPYSTWRLLGVVGIDDGVYPVWVARLALA